MVNCDVGAPGPRGRAAGRRSVTVVAPSLSLSLYDGNLIHTPIKCDVIMKNNHIAKRHFENWGIVSASVSVCTVPSNFQNGTK